MEELSELLLQRRRKVDALWEAGINPYPNDFKPQHTSADIIAAYGSIEQLDASDASISVAGRILARRSFGKAAFIQLQDRKGRIQLYVKKDEIGEEAFAVFDSFDIGDIIGAVGYPFRTKTGELSLHIRSIRLLVKSLLPLPEKFHGLTDVETRYRQRYVDLIVNPEAREIFFKRGKTIMAQMKWLLLNKVLKIRMDIRIFVGMTMNVISFSVKHTVNAMRLRMRF